MKLIEVNNLSKTYKNECHALKKISFDVDKGEFIAIIGSSGSGKSTLLRCINRIIEPTKGSILFEGQETTCLKGKKLRNFRRKIGMIFQHYNLVNRLTVIQNVLHGRLGYMNTLEGIFGLYSEDDKQKALDLINRVGLSEYVYKKANELSGGQKQRVGIVRALMQEPSLLLCDEPISSLDPCTSKLIMDTIKVLSKERNITCMVNLHQVHVAKEYATRIIGIRDGSIVFDDKPNLLTQEAIEKIYSLPYKEIIKQEEMQLDGLQQNRKNYACS